MPGEPEGAGSPGGSAKINRPSLEVRGHSLRFWVQGVLGLDVGPSTVQDRAKARQDSCFLASVFGHESCELLSHAFIRTRCDRCANAPEAKPPVAKFLGRRSESRNVLTQALEEQDMA